MRSTYLSSVVLLCFLLMLASMSSAFTNMLSVSQHGPRILIGESNKLAIILTLGSICIKKIGETFPVSHCKVNYSQVAQEKRVEEEDNNCKIIQLVRCTFTLVNLYLTLYQSLVSLRHYNEQASTCTFLKHSCGDCVRRKASRPAAYKWLYRIDRNGKPCLKVSDTQGTSS